MTIHLIACVALFENKLAIGRGNDLLFNISDDLRQFKTLTCEQNGDGKNIIVMGRKTWFSIPMNKRPLKNRINIVLTRDKNLHKLSSCPVSAKLPFVKCDVQNTNKNVMFMTFDDFKKLYKKSAPNTFIIGGGEIYDLFMSSKDFLLRPDIVYLTEVMNYKPKDNERPTTFMPHLDKHYQLTSMSHRKFDKYLDLQYYFLTYTRCQKQENKENCGEDKYLNLCKRVLDTGEHRTDRTGVGTIGLFGAQLRFDISQTVPLMTTKRVPWRHVIEELLWFCRGDTDAKILQRANVHIWDGNTSRNFLDKCGLTHYEEGILGPGYGWQMRFFGAKYSQAFSDTSKIDKSKVGGVDQLDYIVNELKTNPYSRRILMCYWNPQDFPKTALLPCHFSCQFYVRHEQNNKYLDCQFNMRSNDLFLGHPFNIFSYTVLTYIIALKCDLLPGHLIFTGGDIHIYNNHVQQVKAMLSREPRPAPALTLDTSIKYKKWNEITVSDFNVVGYFPHPSIKAPMAV